MATYIVDNLQATSTTDSSSSVTGSATTAGGLGVAKKLYVGTDSHVAGVTYADSKTDASSSITGAVINAGGLGVAKKLYVGTDSHTAGVTYADSTTEATTGGAGSLVSAGGIYAAKAIINGSTTDSSSTTTGAVVSAGGAAFAKTVYVGTGVVLPTSGASGSDTTLLDYYEEYTLTTNMAGPCTINSVGFKIIRVGKVVTMTMIAANISGTSTASTTFANATAIPTRFRPSNQCYDIMYTASPTYNPGWGVVYIGTNGVLTIYNSMNNPFPNSGTVALFNRTWTWNLT
jgi:hypothetical protein